MKFTRLAVGILCSAALFCGCTKNSDIVLKINDKEITRAEFYNDFNKIKQVNLKDAPKELKTDKSYPVLMLKSQFLTDFVVKELISQEFDKQKITSSEDEIKAKKEQIIKQLGSEEQFNKILKENGISNDKLRADLELEVKGEKLFKKLGEVKVSDSEVQKYYNANKNEFNKPQQVKSSHILINTDAEMIKRTITDADKDGKLSQAEIDKKTKEEVIRKEQLVQDLRKKAVANPKNFAKLAKEYSEDKGSAQNGGDIGFVTKDKVVKEYADAIFDKKAGTITPPVKSQFGTHIILITDKKAAGVQSFASVKNDLKSFLLSQKKQQQAQKYIESLKNQAKIEYLDSELNPDNIQKELQEALKTQLKAQQEKQTPQGKKDLLKKNK